MKLVVCGGRDYNEAEYMFGYLDAVVEHVLPKVTMVLLGACPTGADQHAMRWAKYRNLGYKFFPADWDKHGRAAGPIRNRQMAEEGDYLVAFPGGRGTQSMIGLARSHDLVVIEVTP